MKRFSALLSTILLLLVVATTVRAKDEWISVRSKNFFLVGNNSEKEVKKVAARLEQFRDVFTRLFPGIKFNSPVPITVVVFKSDASFRPFKPGANVAGYFQAGADINYIALTTELFSGEDPFTVIFHEYTHFLINNTSGRVPVWFNEGLAEYYSTFSITDDQKFNLGKPIGNHVFLLRDSKMLPLRTLLQVDHDSPHYNERDKRGIFYAQSWALMHYLVIGKAGRVDQLGKFMELISTNVPMEQAFQQAFEMAFEAMEKELRSYIKQSRYNVLSGHFERKLETDTSMESAPISEAEAQAYLGDLLLHSHRKDSETYIQKALKLDPNLAMAHASLGRLRLYEGKFDEARASLERAVQANSQNYLIHYYYAHILSRSAVGPDGRVTSYPPETAAKIYEELQKAIALRPDYPESYSLLGFVSLVTGERVEESIKLLNQAVGVSPGRTDLLFTIAQLYMRKSDFKSARPLLEQVTKSNAENELRQHAKTLLDQVVAYQGRVETSTPSTVESADEDEKPADAEKPTTNVSTSTDKPAAQVATDPSAYLREVLRPVAEGETQLQGTLLRIECEGKVIVFFLKVGEQTLRLRTPSFDDVEITTYNPQVKGDITCGPKKIDEPVVVCFKPITDKRLRADGTITSIEFVPKDFKLK